MVSEHKKFFITAVLPFVLLGAAFGYVSFASASGSGDMPETDSQIALKVFVEDVGSRMENAFETMTNEVKQQLESDFNKVLMGVPKF